MKTLGSVVEIPHKSIRPFRDQPRAYFDQGALRDLARSIKAAGQRTPIVVRPLRDDPRHEYELVDGQRRWHAVGMLRQETIRAIIEEFNSADDQFMASVVANFAREGHSAVEIAHAIDRLLKHPKIAALPDSTRRVMAIAEIFGKSVPWVYGHHSLLKLHKSVLALMHPGVKERHRITLQVAQLLTTLPQEMQISLAKQISAASLGMKAAKLLVDRTAREAGLRAGAPRRYAPTKRRQGFVGSLNLIATEANRLMDLRLDDFRRMFEGRNRAETESVMYRIEDALERLTELRDAVRRFMKITARAA